MSKKPLPRLSEDLVHRRDPHLCQACGVKHEARPVTLWQEYDVGDVPTPVLVALCEACADRLIERHPRLYRRTQIAQGEPFPGGMPACITCIHRDGLACKHPDLRANGGPGLRLRFNTPADAFVDYRGKGGRREGCRMKVYHGPVQCDGFQEDKSRVHAPCL